MRVVALTVAALILGGVAGYLRLLSGGREAPPARYPGPAATPVSGVAPDPVPGAGAPTAGASGAGPATGVRTPAVPLTQGGGSGPGTGSGTAPAGAAGAPATPAAAGASLELSQNTVDLGPVNSSASLDLHNTGTASVDFQFGPAPAWLAVTPVTGTIPGGGHRSVIFSLDRTAAPVGVVDVSVAVAARGGTPESDAVGAVRVTAQVSGPPVIDSVSASPAVVLTRGCPPTSGPTLSVVSVRATDTTGVVGAELVARLPDGRTTTTGLSLDSATGQQSTWSGPVGPSGTEGSLSFTVTVTDINGLRAQSTGSLEVRNCPAPAASASPGPS